MKPSNESIPQGKIDAAAMQLASIQGKSWSTPAEFKALFPNFDSDVRMALPRMIRENRTPDSLRVLDMVNFVNYLGTTYGSAEHRAIGSELLPRLFPSATPDQRLGYIVDALRFWVRVRAPKMEEIKEALRREIGGRAGNYFVSNLDRFRTVDGCMSVMLFCRSKINEKTLVDTEYEYLESTAQLVSHILTNDYGYENDRIYAAWLRKTDSLKDSLFRRLEQMGKSIDEVKIPEEWITIPYEYERSASQTLDEAYERSEEQKLTIFISLAKIFGLK